MMKPPKEQEKNSIDQRTYVDSMIRKLSQNMKNKATEFHQKEQ